jgi:Xaa-Pro aminopeptidase
VSSPSLESEQAPVFIDGIGAFTIEENIVVTQNGYESLNRLSREYRELH